MNMSCHLQKRGCKLNCFASSARPEIPDAARLDTRHCYQPEHAARRRERQTDSQSGGGWTFDSSTMFFKTAASKKLIPQMQAATRNGLTYLHCPRIRFVPQRCARPDLASTTQNNRRHSPLNLQARPRCAGNPVICREMQSTTIQCADELRG